MTIKPSNVIVTEAGRVVLVDFGLTAPATRTRLADDPEELAGTPLCMAPEQFLGERRFICFGLVFVRSNAV